MNYRITRTSDWGDNSPCEEAVKGTYIDIDERTTDSPDKIPANLNQPTDWWYKDGTNHRVENGHIKRDFIRDGWIVDINSVDDLRKLSDKYGNLIFNSTENSIEIYDDYRE